jgi:ribosome-associated protein
MDDFKLEKHEYVALCDLLKNMGLCQSGGEAKSLIAEGKVLVDGEVELRKRCKIRKGQLVEFNGQAISIT